MTSRLLRAVIVFGLVIASSAIAGRADAACHAFTVSASPSSVAEGGKVTVTVTRDANVNPSSVRVTTVDGSARAPGDYTKLDQQVSMTTEESRTLTIQTKDDASPEGAETFRVRVHDASGCAVNSDFEYGPDAVVTIKASDPATPAPAARTQPPAAPAPNVTAAATTPTLSPTPTLASPTAEATTSPEATLATQAATETEDRGLPAAAIAGIVLGAIAAASGAGLLWYRRRAG